MSFSVELWDGYDLVYNNFNLHRRGLKDFIYMLNEKHNYELDFAKGMKKIYDMNYAVTKMPSLQNGILAFKNDLVNQYNYTLEFVNSLREEVIDPLKQIMTEQNNSGKILNNEAKKVERDYRDNFEKMERARLKFHNYAKNSEDAKIQSELAKINLSISHDQKSRIEMKAQNTLKEAKEAERVYISSVNIANNSRDAYIEVMKRTLNEFQSMEEKLIECIKDSLRKYVIYQVALVRTMQYDVERKAGVMESINVQADIRSFIEKNSTNSLPPSKFEFIPYMTDIDSRANVENNKYPKEVLENVKNFISNVFYTEPPENELDSLETKTFNEIDAIVNLAWEGKKLPEQEKLIFIRFIKEKRYRRFFLNGLNKYRLSGFFTLDEKSYFIVGELIYLCLDEIIKDKDYHSAKQCMNLAQTLYKAANQPNKPRVFLQNVIEDHPLWKSADFWEEFLKYIINEEMHSQKNYNIYTFESSKDKSKRLKTTVVNQLISFSYNMLSFDMNKERVKDIILYFAKYFDIDEESRNGVIKNLEEFNLMNQNKIKDDENEKNNPISVPVEQEAQSELTENLTSDVSEQIEKEENNDWSLLSTNCRVSDEIVSEENSEPK